MKKLLLSIIIILISLPAFALFGFGEDEEEVCKPQPEIVKCHYALNWHEDEKGRKRYFIFSVETLGKCGKLSQVGELNEQNHAYRKYRGQSKVLWGTYGGDRERKEIISSAWGGELYPIEFYEGPQSQQDQPAKEE